MVAKDFFEHLQSLHVATYVGLEDFVDKLNFLFTVGLLLLCTTIVTVKTYFMSPLECILMTASGGENLNAYTSTVCWTEGTYAIKPEEYSNLEIGSRWHHMVEFQKNYESRRIFYYQWVPFMLGLQCILFYMPRLFWQLITYNKTGTDLGHLIAQASAAVHADKNEHDKIIGHLVKTIEQLLFLHREYRVGRIAQLRRRAYNIFKVLVPSKRLGTWLVFMYFFIKVLYMSNCVGQLYLMQHFLSPHGPKRTNFTLDFGFRVLQDLSQGREWHNSLVFPRISFCVFTLKAAGSIHHHMAQCALPINMLNEKIYVFLWFWFIFCALLTALSLPVWIARMLFVSLRTKFIKRFLKLSSTIDVPSKSDVTKFVKEFLRHDGAFIVRMIALNAGDLICSEVVCGLFDLYVKHHYDEDFRGQPCVHSISSTSKNKSTCYSIALAMGEGGTATLRRKVNPKSNHVDDKLHNIMKPSAPLLDEYLGEQGKASIV